MAQVRRHSAVSEEDMPPVVIPPSLSPDIRAAAVRLLTRAEAMGLIAPDDLLTLSSSSLNAALSAFHQAGIGRFVVSERDVEQNLRGALDLMNEVVLDSPHPASEWSAILRVLGPELVARLVGVSDSSIRRYASGDRETPSDVAERLHWLAMRVADLAGAYNRFGIQRWFERGRRALDGRSPADRLSGHWSPDDAAIMAVADLAAKLVTIDAT